MQEAGESSGGDSAGGLPPDVLGTLGDIDRTQPAPVDHFRDNDDDMARALSLSVCEEAERQRQREEEDAELERILKLSLSEQ